LTVVVPVYLAVIACLGGLGYWISGNAWAAMAGAAGWFVGILLIRTPPVRRRLNERYVKHQGGGPPDAP
jgi:hypothetical protein